MSKKYRSDAMAAIHETMEALHEINAIDKQTMRRFDEVCLTPVQIADAQAHCSERQWAKFIS
jgi:putative transcriptional regulator